MDRKDIYRQDQCTHCHGFFYKEELQRDEADSLICKHCLVGQVSLKQRFHRILDIPLPWGISLMELLAVILILGIAVGTAIPTLMYLRQRAVETELRDLYYGYQDTDLGVLAEQAMTAFEQGESLEDIPELTGIELEDIELLEDKLCKCINIDVEELKLGAAIKALVEWQNSTNQLTELE